MHRNKVSGTFYGKIVVGEKGRKGVRNLFGVKEMGTVVIHDILKAIQKYEHTR